MIIDLSQHNGTVNFKSLTGVNEVFVRASLGYGVFDKLLAEHAKGAASAGLPVSYYHFAYPSVGTDGSVCSDAVKEATYFVDTIAKLAPYTHLAVDLENWNSEKGEDTKLSPEEMVHWLQCFLDTVQSKTGTKCIIYSYADYLNRHLPANHPFGTYPLWIANYNAKLQKPPLPKGWTSYLYWQYSESGTLAGVNGHVDLSKTA